MTAVVFLEQYAEFDSLDPTHVETFLDEAAGKISADVLGDRYEEAHGALTAALLWDSPFGAPLRLDGNKNPYWTKFNGIKRDRAPTIIVI